MAYPEVVTGDNQIIMVSLQDNDEAIDAIDSSSLVSARVVEANRTSGYTDSWDVDESTPGSDWSNAVVAVAIPGEETRSITYQGRAFIELQITYGGYDRTWFVPVKIVRGNV